jgi:hypothetical protein
MFRVPTRMLVTAAFPLAFLAGVSADAVVRGGWAINARLALSRGFRRATLFVGVPTVLGLVFSDGPVSRAFVAYWVVVVVSLPLFVRVLQHSRMSPRTRTAVWCGILVVELVVPVMDLTAVKPQAELYPSSPAMDYLAARPGPVRVLDWDTGGGNAEAAFLGVGAPQSMVHRLDTPRGYNPLDVRHYREFLEFVVVTEDPGPARGNSRFTRNVVPNFENYEGLQIRNPELFRLLAVTHRVAPADAPKLPGEWEPRLVDPAPPAPPPLKPASPNPLPPHTLSEATNPHPRAWIVPRAEKMPAGNEFSALRRCDFSTTVLITSDTALSLPNGDRPGVARITEYRPNRIVAELDGTGGWLVLSDVWFPGWTCRVDGVEVPVERANHTFRAVPVPPGAKRVEFTFAPRSYRVGWWVSVVAVVALALATVVGLLLRLRRREPVPASPI